MNFLIKFQTSCSRRLIDLGEIYWLAAVVLHMGYNISSRSTAELHSYIIMTSPKNFLLSKLKIRRSEKIFLHAEKRIMDMFFWLDCLNIVL